VVLCHGWLSCAVAGEAVPWLVKLCRGW